MAFQYAPLKEARIRLLRLLPPGPEGHPRLQLVNNVAIAQKDLNYTALSYCWGDAKDTLPAVVDGLAFNITRNLHEALGAIRDHHHDTVGPYIWIDAICIDQANTQEKSIQVSQMWRVFSAAQLVFAWLGPEDETSHLVFETLHTIREKLGSTRMTSKEEWVNDLIDLHFTDFKEEYRKSGAASKFRDQSESPSEFSKPCLHLIERDYFWRVWTITECAQSSDLIFACGGSSCTWEELDIYIARTCDWFVCSLDSRAPPPLYAKWWHQFNLRHPRGSELTSMLCELLELVDTYVKANCSDARDRIFAMLGHPFVQDCDPLGRLQPDYSISEAELYILTLKWIDELCGDTKYQRTKGSPENFATDFALPLREALRLTDDEDMLHLVHCRHASVLVPESEVIVLSNGRKISCSGPLLGELVSLSNRWPNRTKVEAETGK